MKIFDIVVLTTAVVLAAAAFVGVSALCLFLANKVYLPVLIWLPLFTSMVLIGALGLLFCHYEEKYAPHDPTLYASTPEERMRSMIFTCISYKRGRVLMKAKLGQLFIEHPHLVQLAKQANFHI